MEMRVARLRALTHRYINVFFIFCIVEMRVARLRALTQALRSPEGLTHIRGNESCPS